MEFSKQTVPVVTKQPQTPKIRVRTPVGTGVVSGI